MQQSFISPLEAENRQLREQMERMVAEHAAEKSRYEAELVSLRQANRELQDLGDRYNLLIANAAEAISIVQDGKVVLINRALQQMLHIPRADDLLGQPALQYFHPEHHATVLNRMRELLVEGRFGRRAQYTVVRADGEQIEAEIISMPCSYGGRPAIQSIINDITEQKRTDATLHASLDAERLMSERLLAVYEIERDLICAENMDTLCCRAVELGRKRLGFERLGIWFFAPEREEILGSFGTDADGNTQDERNLVLEYPVREVIGQFREGNFAIVPDMAWIPEGANDQFMRLNAALWYGDQVIGYLSCDNLLTLQPISPLQQQLLVLYASTIGALCARKRFELELEGRVQARTLELEEANGRLETELRQRRQAEEALRDSQQRIHRLNRDLQVRAAQLEAANQELESFCYSVSHDLRAPLRTIDGFSTALMEDYAEQLDAMAVDYLQRVRAATQRMAHLIDDLLSLSRVTRSEIRRTRVDLSALAQSIASELAHTAPDRQVEFSIQPDMKLKADAGMMRIVMENLLGNSWKFTSKHPNASIAVGMKAAEIKAAGIDQPEETVFFVRDDGAGFDMAYSDKLFGAFQRLHGMNEFEGTGIGLATVQRIIHRHGGRVWAEGAVEQGATFYFTL
jgi:PAS domain S-box-containing protein